MQIDIKTYQDMMEYAKLPIMFVAEDKTILLCNRAFEKLTGFTKEQIQGKMTWPQLVKDPDDLRRMEEYHRLRRLGVEDVPEEYEFRLYNRDGEPRHIAVGVSLLPGTKQSLVILQDITEKRKTETWYRAIFDNTGLPSIIIGADTTIIRANTEWANLSGYSVEENEGKRSWTSFVHPQDLERMRSYHQVRRLDADRAPRKYEFRFIRRSGEIRCMINSVTMIPGSSYSIASLLDITEFREAEEKRRKLEEQLQQARKLESIGHLAGGVAHDFNNMLAAILGYSQLVQLKLGALVKSFTLQKSETGHKLAEPDSFAPASSHWIDEQMALSGKIVKMVDDIIKASLQAKDITRQLLAFARKQTLEVKVLYLNDIVEDFLKILRRTIREDIEIELKLNPEKNPIEADAGQLRQVILNLVLNAQDAMPQGGKILITTENRTLDAAAAMTHEGVTLGPCVMMVVSDTGVGMEKEIQGKIFEPFFTTKKIGKGTGLGLATVYGIVKQHRGNIWFYSEPGLGTTFQVYFPQVTREAAAQPDPGFEAGSAHNEMVLVVEDQEEVRNMTSQLLTYLGYRVMQAENAQEALRICGGCEEKIHVMVSDVVMPGMNGRELYQELRKTRPELKVLFVSGYPQEIITDHGILEEGFNFLAKPILMDELARKLRQVLTG